MSRQETSNTFSEGLIKDLNPINTPSTALTDCVNGTIITYDGNEYSLQNDKGNYGLKNCKLSPNYIPVGIKEYGDILYIVSYNPLDESVEIGSYPSPQTITNLDESNPDSDPLNSGNTVTSIYNKLKRDNKTEVSYQEVVENYSKLYVFYGKNPDETKMHEGDQIKLSVGDLSNNPFERLQYVLVNDNRQITDISDKVKPYIGSNNYKYISWGPGWFGFRPIIAEISDNIINIKKIKVPPYNTGSASLVFNVRISTSDQLLTKLDGTNLSNLKAEVKLTGKVDGKDETIWEDKKVPLNNPLNLKNGEFYYFSNDITISEGIDITKYSSITLTATPVIYLDGTTFIKYDHLERSSIFNLSAKGDPKDFLLGEIYWNWKTDSANNSFSLTFDTTGLSQASVLDVDVFLKYSISGLDGTPILDLEGMPYTDRDCPGWNISGETTIEFDTTPFTKENYETFPYKLYTENIYKIEFTIVDESGNIIREFGPRIIVATELLNSSTASRYDEVPIDKWLNNYIDSIKDATFDINASQVGNWGTPNRSNPQIYNTWINPKRTFKAGDTSYSTFLSELETESASKEDSITWTKRCNLSIKCKSNIQLLTGPMWLNFNEGCKVEFNGKTCSFDKFTGKLLNSCTIKAEGRATKTIPCTLVSLSQDNEIWSYEETNPTYRELTLSTVGHFQEVRNSTDKRRELKLTYTLKSGINSLWSKTWNLVWWKNDHENPLDTESSVVSTNILDALKNDDLGLITMAVGQINERNNFSWIGLKETTGTGEKNVLMNSGKGGWTFNSAYKQFLVIKLNGDVLFVKIPDTYWTYGNPSKESVGVDAISRFCSEVKLTKTIDSSSTTGGFWTMELGETEIKDSPSVTINSKLLFPDELKVGNFNLLNKSTIPDDLSLSTNKYLFESVVLKPNKESIGITADFSDTNEDESSLRNSVEERNEQVEVERLSYIGDSKYASGFTKGILYEPAGISFINKGVLIDYMNNKIHRPNTVLYGGDHHSENDHSGTIKKRIGKIAADELK